jgi:metal-responsive CopG/Arc/MetJ family transcriptional regulator
MNIERSKLVEEALTDFIEGYKHRAEDHKCCGVIIAEAVKCGSVEKALEEYRDVVINYTHSHVESHCICTVIVSGSWQRIRDLQRELMLSGNRARYVPVAHE